MAYARFGEDSDIHLYVFGNGWNLHITEKYGEHCGGNIYMFHKPSDVFTALEMLQVCGYKIPANTIENFRRDLWNKT